MEMTMARYDNGFSWARVKMVAAYYYPVIKPQMIWYPIVVAVLYGLALLCQTVEELAAVGVTFIAPYSFMLYLAPIILARRDNRLITSMLPATAAEKMAFLAVYFFVMIPLMIFGVEYALVGITHLVVPEYDFVMKTLDMVEIDDYLLVLNQLDELMPLAMCFWGVIYFKENRTLKAILVSVGAMIALGVIGAIYGIVCVGKTMIDAQQAGAQFDEKAFADSFTMQMAQNIEPLIIGLGGFSVMFVAFMIWRSYSHIKNYQI